MKPFVEKYETARRCGVRLEVEKLVKILQSDDEDRLQQVFGDKQDLLQQYLEDAEERKRNGITEEPRRKRQKKVHEEEVQPEEEETYEEEQPIEVAEVDYHAQEAHEHTDYEYYYH